MTEKKKGKLDQILDKLSEQDKRFDAHDNSFKKIADKLLEHDGKFETMDAKIDDKFDKVLTGLDKIMGEMEKSRQDRVLAKGKDDEQDRRIGGLEGRMQKIDAKVA